MILSAQICVIIYKPDTVADDLRRKPVATVGRAGDGHDELHHNPQQLDRAFPVAQPAFRLMLSPATTDSHETASKSKRLRRTGHACRRRILGHTLAES